MRVRLGALWRTAGFGVRLLATFLLALAAIAAVQYRLVLTDTQAWALAERVEIHAAGAHTLNEAFVNPPEGLGRVEALRRELGVIADRPGIGQAVLVGDGGAVLTASQGADGIDPADEQAVTEAIAERRGTGRVQPGEGRRRLTIVVPVRLPIGQYALVVTEQATRVYDQQVDALRRRTLIVLALGAPVGLPLFSLLGGRSLTQRHRVALARSNHDALTGAGNHRSYQEEIHRQVSLAGRHGQPLALALIDVDDFKTVNDRFGHRRGDAVLVEVAALLADGRMGDRVFRVGGDEFALILPFARDEAARLVAERLRRRVEEGVASVTLSIGIAELGTACRDAESLWEGADSALYEAKRRGRNMVVHFAEVEDAGPLVTPAKAEALRGLLADGAIGAAFQPIVWLGSRQVLGYEALARPRTGHALSGPGEAFAIAERLGRVAELDARCRAAILARARELPADALLFLNLAPAALGHASLAGDALARDVRAAGRTPGDVVLEITERSVAARSVVVREVRRLQELGFRMALDDVGAGNAGLELLRSVPDWAFVKVDREVVAAAPSDRNARAVLHAVVAFAAETQTVVIAEGVESEDVLGFLGELGSHERRGRGVQAVQGYLLGMPRELPAALPEVGILR